MICHSSVMMSDSALAPTMCQQLLLTTDVLNYPELSGLYVVVILVLNRVLVFVTVSASCVLAQGR